MLGAISDFHHIRPHHEVDQEIALQWIAKTHATAECGSSGDFDVFCETIQGKLARIGLGKQQIESRGVLISDLFEVDPAKRRIYPVEQEPHGQGFAQRSAFFDEEVSRIFEEFYPEGALLPNHLIHVTCTGYVAPSPAQKLVSSRKAETTVTHAYHMGCYGAISAVRISAGYACLPSSSQIDIVHSEVCSLHMHPLCHRSEQLLVESLFADGFIKYSLRASEKKPHLKVKALHEEMVPDSTHAMSWNCGDHGLAMTLSKEVPILIARAISGYLQRMCSKAGVNGEKIVQEAYFAIHPGGPKILQQIQQLLKLESFQMQHSQDILKAYGNMSSATLPHIWERMLADPQISSGAWIISMAFGPGLTIAGSLFQKEGG